MKNVLFISLFMIILVPAITAQEGGRVKASLLDIDVPRTTTWPLEHTFVARSQRHQSAAEAFLGAAVVLTATGIIIGEDVMEPLFYAAGASFLASYSFNVFAGKQRGRAIRLMQE
jgi:hypothetical protein